MPNQNKGFPSTNLAALIQRGRRITYGIVQPGEFVEDGVILVRGRDYSFGWRPLTEFMRVTAEIDAPYKRSKLKPGDLLMTIVGANTGTVAVVPHCLEGANITQTTARIAVDPRKAVPDFVEQVLRSDIGQNEVHHYQKGGAQPGLNLADVEKFCVPLPPLPEQRRIAAILGTWDAAIEKAERLLDAAQRQFEALRTELYREDGSEERLTFGGFLDESRIPGNDGSTARKLTVKLYGKGIGPKQDRTAGSANTRYYIRRAGQFIYSRLDFLNGAFAVVPDHLDGFQSTLDLPAFEIAPRVNSIWLLNYVTRPAYYQNQRNLARGQRIARRVNPDDLFASEIAVPTRERQDEAAAILTLCIDGINSIRSLVVALRRQKTGLMQKLLTGQVCVPEAVADLSPAAD